jgi:hypothetical protein
MSGVSAKVVTARLSRKEKEFSAGKSRNFDLG